MFSYEYDEEQGILFLHILTFEIYLLYINIMIDTESLMVKHVESRCQLTIDVHIKPLSLKWGVRDNGVL